MKSDIEQLDSEVLKLLCHQQSLPAIAAYKRPSSGLREVTFYSKWFPTPITDEVGLRAERFEFDSDGRIENMDRKQFIERCDEMGVVISGLT